MKRFFEMKCDSCGTVAEKWVRLDEIQETECPRCGKKDMKRVYSSFMTGASCRTGLRGFRGG
ncbi:MAG: FmdB family zinc ribbon protein [Planctomycetota bacterium]|jgi:putative FmdB family regulatory protein